MSRRRSYMYAMSRSNWSLLSALKKIKGSCCDGVLGATKSIRLWCSQKDELVALKNSRKSRTKRPKEAGRKPIDQSMDEVLFSWIVWLRSRNLRVSRSMIRVQGRAPTSNTVSEQVWDRSADFWRDTLFPFDGKQIATVCQCTIPLYPENSEIH